MRINGWDISSANGKQWAVIHNAGYTIKSNSVWNEGAPAPLLFDSYCGLKTKQITIKVTGSTREAALTNCSKIAGALTGVVDIEFDNYSHRFRGNVTSITHSEFDKRKLSHRLVIKVDGFEYGGTVSADVSGSTAFSLNCNGTMATPAILDITATQNIVTSVLITGFGKQSIELKKMMAGDHVIINGETGIITKNGLPNSDVVVWSRPVLKPGVTNITVGSNSFTFIVKHSPRYM